MKERLVRGAASVFAKKEEESLPSPQTNLFSILHHTASVLCVQWPYSASAQYSSAVYVRATCNESKRYIAYLLT